MKKALIILTNLILVLSLGLLSTGCPAGPAPITSPTGTPTGAQTGKIEVKVTDAPGANQVTSIMVTVSKVQIHKAGIELEPSPSPSPSITATPTEPPASPESTTTPTPDEGQTQEEAGEWITIDLTGSPSFDLLKIKGAEELLAASEVQPGKYTQVRLIVDKIEVGLDGGELKPAIVPSGELKFNHPFNIVVGQKTIIVLDFDADKSVNVVGTDEIHVRPVVKLTVK